MKLSLSTLLDVSPERAWEVVQTPDLLEHVAAPLVRFDAIDPSEFPEQWEEADYLVRMALFGIVPLGTHSIRIVDREVEETGQGRIYRLRTDETGELAETWQHDIVLRETPDGMTVYTDEVTIEAGLLTLPVWLFATLFYRHRHRRWRQLAATGFDSVRGHHTSA